MAGYYGFENAGDELILRAILRDLRRRDPGAVITVLSGNPALTAMRHAVRAVDRWKPWKWLGAFLNSDVFILGGGGLLQESTGRWNHAYYLMLPVAAKLAGCRIRLLAIGVEPIRSLMNRLLTRWILNNWADEISVRDAESKDALLEAGVTVPIRCEEDPVIPMAREIIHISRRLQKPPSGIALAVSPVPGRTGWLEHLVEVCGRIQLRAQIPIDLLVFFPAQDEEFSRDLARRSGAIRRVRTWSNPSEILPWYLEYLCVAGTRFHALAIAAGAEIPFAGWASQRKVEILCRERQMPYWVPAGSMDPEEQSEKLLELCKRPHKSVILPTRIY